MGQNRLIEVSNIAEFRRDLRKMDKDVRDKVKELDKETVTEIGEHVPEFTPQRSGRLVRSLKAGADNKGGFLAVGTPGRVRYAPVIHWGFPRRNIKRTGFIIRGMAKFGREYNGDFANFYMKRLVAVLNDFAETTITDT